MLERYVLIDTRDTRRTGSKLITAIYGSLPRFSFVTVLHTTDPVECKINFILNWSLGLGFVSLS